MKAIVLFLLATCIYTGAAAQNISMNILVRNSGKVSINGTVMLEVTVCNLDAAVHVPAYKLRPQLSVPAIVAIADEGHVLPAGWSITSGKASQVWLSNGADTLAPGDCRTILIAMKGIAAGGPSTVSGNLLFANGTAPGNIRGAALPGDVPEDNHSTSTVEVTGKEK